MPVQARPQSVAVIARQQVPLHQLRGVLPLQELSPACAVRMALLKEQVFALTEDAPRDDSMVQRAQV
jgi:hypothetical protein